MKLFSRKRILVIDDEQPHAYEGKHTYKGTGSDGLSAGVQVKAKKSPEDNITDVSGEPDFDDTREWYYARIESSNGDDTFTVEWENGGQARKKRDEIMLRYPTSEVNDAGMFLLKKEGCAEGISELPFCQRVALAFLTVCVIGAPEMILNYTHSDSCSDDSKGDQVRQLCDLMDQAQ